MAPIDYSLLLLNKKQYFENEIKSKLLKKFDNEKMVLETIETLKVSRFIDDDLFIKEYIKHMIENKHFGIYRIKDKLLNRGLSFDYFKDYLESIDEETFIASLFRYIEELIDRNCYTYEQIVKKCQYRGWKYSQINKVLEKKTKFIE